MPKVSVVIPTRNRGHLLKSALTSALRQTYQDTEILVSDNYSSDHTRQVYDSFQSQKLRYVRTSAPLSMPDSWEFALQHARGEYITFLPDDDFLFSDAIKLALTQLSASGLEIAVWKVCSYFAPDWVEPRRRNVLYIPRTSGRCYVVESRVALEKLHQMDRDFPVPRFLNSLCHRRVIEETVQRQGRIFLPPCPDYSAAAGVVHHVERYVVLDCPLFLDALTTASIGASQRFNAGDASQRFLEEFAGSLVLRRRFNPKRPTIAELLAQSLESVHEIYSDGSKNEVVIRPEVLVREVVNDLMARSNHATDDKEAWRNVEDYVSRQPGHVRRAATKEKVRCHAVSAVKKLRQLPFWDRLELLRGINVYRGEQRGFDNIQECGEFAERQVRNSAKWLGALAC